MPEQYMTRETRVAQEEAALASAEKAHNEQFGTTPTPTHPDAVNDNGERSTPNTPEVPVEAVDWQKRYKDLQSYHDKQVNDYKTQLAEAGVAPDESDRVADLEAKLQALQDKDTLRETTDAVSQAQAAVGAAHPDFVDVISSNEFSEWIKGQPDVYQHALYDDRPDAKLSIDALTLFKVQHGMGQANQRPSQQQMQDLAAQAVSGGQREVPDTQMKRQWSWAEINKLTPQQYDKYEKDIDEAILEGRVN